VPDHQCVRTIASMNDSTLDELQEQNRWLRMLVLSLSATLLRKIAIESEAQRSLDSADAERLVREAEESFSAQEYRDLRVRSQTAWKWRAAN